MRTARQCRKGIVLIVMASDATPLAHSPCSISGSTAIGAARSARDPAHARWETPGSCPSARRRRCAPLSPADLKAVGAQIVLANTYHLHVRPGEDVIARLRAPQIHGWRTAAAHRLRRLSGLFARRLPQVDDDGVEFRVTSTRTSQVDTRTRDRNPGNARLRYCDGVRTT